MELYKNIFFCRRYYKETDGLCLDVGAYMKALEVTLGSLAVMYLLIIHQQHLLTNCCFIPVCL